METFKKCHKLFKQLRNAANWLNIYLFTVLFSRLHDNNNFVSKQQNKKHRSALSNLTVSLKSL